MSTTAVAAVPVRTACRPTPASPGWWRFLRRELAPTPGRSARTLQIIAAIVLVQLVSMALHVPEASLSCYLALFLVRENRVSTLMSTVVIAVLFSVAVAATIFCFKYTFDYAELRIPLVMLATFAGMWLSRACAAGRWDSRWASCWRSPRPPRTGCRRRGLTLRSVLWTLVAVCYPALVVYVVGTYVFPIRATDSVIDGINERLEMALAALRTAVRGETPDREKSRDDLDRATHSSAQLLKALGTAEKESSRWTAYHHALTAAITASEQVAASAAALQLATRPMLSDADRSRARHLATELSYLRRALRQRWRPAPRPAEPETPAESAPLRAIQLAVADLRDSLAGSPLRVSPAPPKRKKGLLQARRLHQPGVRSFRPQGDFGGHDLLPLLHRG